MTEESRFGPRHSAKMRGLIFLVVNLAIISSFSVKSNEPIIVDVGEDKDITEINKDLGHDDILEPPRRRRSAVNTESRLWSDGVPYVLDKSLEMNAKGIILRAFEQFGLKSCIAFRPRDSETYYISVQKSGGCFSYVGKVIPNGQPLSIGRFCDEISTVEHEFLHALGFNHEQSRYDRDNFVTIAFENIIE
ncbi:meprin A subunit beta-like, partial [Larimichthys crocea]|uniref:meprin A subunit beta-like n=1 Tax=Larimichthys crocea TaxID=215358 RepID=UPI000F5E476B